MLRRRVSPTETEQLQVYSRIVREALEMDAACPNARQNPAPPVHELGQCHAHPPLPTRAFRPAVIDTDLETGATEVLPAASLSSRRHLETRLVNQEYELDTGQGFDSEQRSKSAGVREGELV